MTSPLDSLAPDERDRVHAAPAPAHAHLMKAVLHRQSFSDPQWLFERKLDGIRCLAIRTADDLRMLSRNDRDLGGRYPAVRDALAAQDGHAFAIDGELVAFAGSQTSFQQLVARDRDPSAVFLYAFDVLWLDGDDVRALPLRTRKRLLRSAITSGGPLRLSTHRGVGAITWVEPELVAQLGFTEWTRAGRLRHPRFQGLRDDKAATEVVRER